MKIIILIITVLVSTFGLTQTSELTNEQQLTWGGKAAVGGYAPEGTLDVQSISIDYTSEAIIALKVVVNMTTLSQENKQLEGHLKQIDFFDVKKYPVATFQLTEPAKINNGKVTLLGQMTIKDKTIEESICADIIVSNKAISIKFKHKMDRTQYGITYNSPSVFEKLKENAIADNFTLKGALTYTKN